jgi:hypothetical protein
MLHPNQFEVNEAWIVFRLNDSLIRTDDEGGFNCIALMDAASCFILASDLFPATADEPTRVDFRRLLKSARRHTQELPKTLFVPRDGQIELAAREPAKHHIDVVRVSESDLLVFIEEARQGFSEQFEERPRDA